MRRHLSRGFGGFAKNSGFFGSARRAAGIKKRQTRPGFVCLPSYPGSAISQTDR